MIITPGKVDVTVDVYFVDDDGGTAPGEPTTGLLFSDIETGGSASYHRQGAARVDFELFTLTSAAAAHTDGGFILIDDTNMPGLYRLDVPDAAFASGVDYVTIQLVAASGKNSVMRPLLIDLRDVAGEVWDRILSGATHNIADSAGRRLRDLQEFGTYEGGAIWVDTVNGVAGTTTYENGTNFNPVSNLADAITLAAASGLSRFKIAPGSTITFAETHNNEIWEGDGWILALGGQDVGGTHFHGATVSGTGTGSSEIHFEDCDMGTCTLNPFHMVRCALQPGTITLGAIGSYIIGASHSGIAGMTTPIIDMGAALGNVDLAMPDYYNGIEIRNLNATGSDTFSISGIGQIVYAASSSGSVNQRGDWKVTNTGGVTITRDDNTANLEEILTGTVTLPGQEAPPLAPTRTEMAAWVYKLFRNKKTQTKGGGALWKLFADDETTVDAKADVSDDGTTATKAEIVSGP